VSTNPYQTPEGQLTTDDLAYGDVKFFSPSSRINRLRYWAHSMLFTFAMIGVFIVIGLLAAFVSETLAIGLGVIAYIAMLVFSFILIIQRLHDLNKTGWMSLLAIIPLANIYLMVLLLFFKGTEGRNNYGLQTPPNKTWHWILAFSFPVLMVVIGILAAIALPAYQGYVERAQSLDPSYSSPDTYPDYPEDGVSGDSITGEEVMEGEGIIESGDIIEEDAPYDASQDEVIEDQAVEGEEVPENTDSETPQ
jgi:uncharacterized membrane protein YhaH (DUF805 family)